MFILLNLFLFCLFFVLLSKSFSHKHPPPQLKGAVKSSPPLLWEESFSFVISPIWENILSLSILHNSQFVLFKNTVSVTHAHIEVEDEKNLFLDLPELAWDKILHQLSPNELCGMIAVCKSLRDRCRSDHLWKAHLEKKWGRVLGDVALREWKLYVASRKRKSLLGSSGERSLLGLCFRWWPLSQSTEEDYLPMDSMMALYISLEKGEFWFPAQVFNRENGYVGFLMSCYDAKIGYNSRTDTFKAKYMPQGWQSTEENIPWHRIRAPRVDVPSNVLHLSNCLHDLKPGDHIEIQWRRNKEFPYGWWYGVVGHLESCHGSDVLCQCYKNEKVILRFDQYNSSSRWRKTVISRRGHKEDGNEVDGYYGGVRKIYSQAEILAWKQFLPTAPLSD